MATPNRCCGQSPKRYHNAHTGKFWLECPTCQRFKMARSHAILVDLWNFSTLEYYPENIPHHINQETPISTLKGSHHV